MSLPVNFEPSDWMLKEEYFAPIPSFSEVMKTYLNAYYISEREALELASGLVDKWRKASLVLNMHWKRTVCDRDIKIADLTAEIAALKSELEQLKKENTQKEKTQKEKTQNLSTSSETWYSMFVSSD